MSWSYILQDTPVAHSADQTWHGATRKDNVPRSDPPGTAPWAQGLRCPSAPCQAWGGFRCPFGAVPNCRGGWYWMPPLAPCRVLRDSPYGTLPGGTATLQPGSELGEVLGSRTGLFPCRASSAQRRRLHFPTGGGEEHWSRLSVCDGIPGSCLLCPATQSTPGSPLPVIDWGMLL